MKIVQVVHTEERRRRKKMEKLKNGKTKKKAIEQSSVRKGSPMKGVRSMAGRI